MGIVCKFSKVTYIFDMNWLSSQKFKALIYDNRPLLRYAKHWIPQHQHAVAVGWQIMQKQWEEEGQKKLPVHAQQIPNRINIRTVRCRERVGQLNKESNLVLNTVHRIANISKAHSSGHVVKLTASSLQGKWECASSKHLLVGSQEDSSDGWKVFLNRNTNLHTHYPQSDFAGCVTLRTNTRDA